MVPRGRGRLPGGAGPVRGRGERGRCCAPAACSSRPDFVDEAELANKRSLNVALLGALCAHLDIPAAIWLEAIQAALPERLHAVNEQAFELGRAREARALAAAGT